VRGINKLDLDLGSSLESLLLLDDLHLSLGTHDTTTPLSAGLLVLLKVTVLDSGDELGELGLVLGADLGDGEDSSGLGLVRHNSDFVDLVLLTFLWTTVPRRALPLTMA
jgi:hypothetical protein